MLSYYICMKIFMYSAFNWGIKGPATYYVCRGVPDLGVGVRMAREPISTLETYPANQHLWLSWWCSLLLSGALEVWDYKSFHRVAKTAAIRNCDNSVYNYLSAWSEICDLDNFSIKWEWNFHMELWRFNINSSCLVIYKSFSSIC